MSQRNVVIIDDESPAREVIRLFLKDFPQLIVVGEAENGFEGMRLIQEQKPDLVFLDVQMPKLTGFELLELLENPPAVIFSTAYDAYAVKAFEVHAIDYLLKPFNRARFAEALEKYLQQPAKPEPIQEAISLQESYQQGPSHQIVVKDGSKINIIPVEEILRIAAQDDYSEIVTSKGRFLKKQTMTQFEKQLDPQIFVRVHRSSIVQVSQIQNIDRYGKESYLASLKNGDDVTVSASGYAKLKQVLGW